jgi:DNA polymerase-3 subunit epsilon
MDRMRLFREMSLRRTVALAGAATAVSTVVLIGLATWLFPRELAVLLAAVFVAALVPWLVVDRLLVARLHDRRNLPARPEFYDFRVAERPLHGDEIGGDEIGGKSLSELRYVVFDTETTGLHPGDGDEIISIAAVRLEGGEIDEAGAFSRLVDPGRPIPPASVRFHGITDDMVKGERSIAEVLSEFRDYVGDAILVGHNADFDMTFLKLKERLTGVEIANVVLDTLLISVFVDHASRNHSLDAVAERLGVAVVGRHTALGDSVATARIFLKLLYRLEARGVTTLGQVAEACAKIERTRRSL